MQPQLFNTPAPKTTQVLFSLPQVAERYVSNAPAIFNSAPGNPADDLPSQLAKVGGQGGCEEVLGCEVGRWGEDVITILERQQQQNERQ